MDAANSDSRSPQRQICSSDECTERMSRRRGSVSLSQSAQHKSLDDQEYDHNREEDEQYIQANEDEQYIQANINLKKLQFLEDHYNDDWLRDLYDPFRATCLDPTPEAMESALLDFFDFKFVATLPSEKFGLIYSCQVDGCLKVFRDRPFVHKHLKEKHPELLQQVRETSIDAVYFRNYMRDPNAPYPEQESDLPPPPPVVVPIPGAGPMGPFVIAPKEIVLKVMGPPNLNDPTISPERRPPASYAHEDDQVVEVIVVEDDSP